MKYNQPFDQPSNPNASYIDGNPAAGIQGSIVPAASIEFDQREIVNAITAAGLAPSNSDLTQLLQMIKIADVFNHFKFATNLGNASQWSASVPPLPSNPPPAGTAIWFKPGFDSIKGGTVFSVNGSPFMPVTNPSLQPVDLGNVQASNWLLLFFDGVEWLIVAGGKYGASAIPALQKTTDWYVNGATGDDSNFDGTSATVASAKIGPFRTIGRAALEIVKYNMNGYNQNIHIADGTYAEAVQFPPLNGSGWVNVTGNIGSPQNVTLQVPVTPTLQSCIMQTGGWYTYDGLRFTTGAGQLDGLTIGGGYGQLKNLRFGPCARFHISVGNSGSTAMVRDGTVTIETGANAAAHIHAETAGYLCFPAAYPANWPSLNILGAVNFTSGFATSLMLGITTMKYASITGAAAVTGPKYNAVGNGIVDSYNSGTSYFPGSAAGSLSTGGQYVS